MLEQTKAKLHSFKGSCDLVLGDAERLPFVAGAFDGLVCMSTMHYFDRQDKVIQRLLETLKKGGIFVYGDLTVHELDNEGFLEGLEKTVSKAHARYCKPSEIKGLLETCGFTKSKTVTFAYRKPYRSLMEDKGEYFGVPAEALNKHVQSASANAKARYGLTGTELTLYYTVITAQKQNRDQ
jgi:ubiquinone/menaquinone biosynthesis C-methylase UbiE